MTAVLCMPTCFIYRALCPAGTAKILIRRKLPAAAGAEHLLFCMIRFSPKLFWTSGTAACTKQLIRQQFPAAVDADYFLSSIKSANALIDRLSIRLRNGHLIDRSFLFIRMRQPPAQKERHRNQEQDRQTV